MNTQVKKLFKGFDEMFGDEDEVLNKALKEIENQKEIKEIDASGYKLKQGAEDLAIKVAERVSKVIKNKLNATGNMYTAITLNKRATVKQAIDKGLIGKIFKYSDSRRFFYISVDTGISNDIEVEDLKRPIEIVLDLDLDKSEEIDIDKFDHLEMEEVLVVCGFVVEFNEPEFRAEYGEIYLPYSYILSL